MIIEIICFWGFGKKFGKPKTLKSPILQGKSIILYCFTRIHSPKRCFWERFWEGFGAFLGNAERMVYMRKKNYKGRCERRTIDKAEGVCRFYSKIQSVYADKLVENEQVVEIHCNVLLEGLDTEAYTTDFLCKKKDGSYMIRECVERKYITKPKTVKLLDVSLDYWRKRGIEDWGIVVDKEVPDHEEK